MFEYLSSKIEFRNFKSEIIFFVRGSDTFIIQACPMEYGVYSFGVE